MMRAATHIGLAALALLSASILFGAESSATADPVQLALDKAKAAKKEANDEKAKSYLEAHLLYKNCEKEFRPFCMMSAQMIMRHADARYRNRERQEFANIVSLEAAVAASAGGATPR